MHVGLLGLGRMGAGMARRLHDGGHEVVVWNRTIERARALEAEGIEVAQSIEALVTRLVGKRVIYMMLPAGEVTETVFGKLLRLVSEGDILIDGGNSRFEDSVRRAALAAERGVKYLDQGTSGGLIGATQGYCLMVGGDASDYTSVEPLLKALALPDGFAHVGTSGAGHYAKMVHNAIEYGMMQSISEGMHLLHEGAYPTYNLAKVADLWQHGSIISSFLLGTLQVALASDASLIKASPSVGDNGEGAWAVEEALRQGVPFMAISAALFARYTSRLHQPFSGRVLSAMRLGFGGHTT
jgi:6-phosphogluconate dehydrogenase